MKFLMMVGSLKLRVIRQELSGYSLEDDWSSESWHVDAVSSSTPVKCQRCGSRKHATESCQADLSRTKCFSLFMKCDMWGLIAQRIDH